MDAQTPPCSQGFTEKQKQTVTDYVRKRYKLPDTITLSLKSRPPSAIHASMN